MPTKNLPPLPLDAWLETRDTLHRWTQVVGKIQLALTPRLNHFWNVSLHISPRGLSSAVIACGDRWFDMELDFIDDVLRLRVSDGTVWTVRLAARSVAEFYADVLAMLDRARIRCRIWSMPAEIEHPVPFDRDFQHHAYDKAYVASFCRIVAWVTKVLTEFRARFVGKSSPVQFYWGHLDLALSRFSGRRSPVVFADLLEREGYSHELFSVGWWPGDSRLEKPAFYAYAAPEPGGFDQAAIATPHAYYFTPLHGFYLDYEDVRRADDPDALLLDFCQRTYEAAANLGRWDRAELERELISASGPGDTGRRRS